MLLNSRTLWLAFGTSGLALIALVVLVSRHDDAGGQAAVTKPVPPVRKPSSDDSSASVDPSAAAVDLIHRPRPLDGDKAKAILAEAADQFKVGVKQTIRPTSSPLRRAFALDPSDGPAVTAAIRAFEEGGHPERLSATVLPAAFDEEKFRSDPDSYINISEPGRVWQAAQPGPSVTPLRRSGEYRPTVKQGESVRLQVRAAAGSPVTFTCFDIGIFTNRLMSQTVIASPDGIGEVNFTTFPGRIGDVRILAASPLHSGRVEFLLHVPQNIAAEGGVAQTNRAQNRRRPVSERSR